MSVGKVELLTTTTKIVRPPFSAFVVSRACLAMYVVKLYLCDTLYSIRIYVDQKTNRGS